MLSVFWSSPGLGLCGSDPQNMRATGSSPLATFPQASFWWSKRQAARVCKVWGMCELVHVRVCELVHVCICELMS